jgi:hypothetical protein
MLRPGLVNTGQVSYYIEAQGHRILSTCCAIIVAADSAADSAVSPAACAPAMAATACACLAR